MDLEAMRALLIPVHGVFGVATLGLGLIALGMPKGKGHRRAGQAFAALLGVAIAIAAPVIILGGNLFLVGIGAFTVYTVAMGCLIARLRGRAGEGAERAFPAAMMLVGGAFAGWGLWVWSRGATLGVVAVVLGAVSAVLARRHQVWLTAPRATRRPWVQMHLSAMGVGLIAAVTAFSTATLPRLAPEVPEVLHWLGPSAILAPCLVLMSRRHRRATAPV